MNILLGAHDVESEMGSFCACWLFIGSKNVSVGVRLKERKKERKYHVTRSYEAPTHSSHGIFSLSRLSGSLEKAIKMATEVMCVRKVL